MSPNFATGLVRYPKASPACESGPGPRARRPQQVWRATEPGPALASVEFISAERTTESYQKQDFIVLVLAAPNPIHKKAKQGLVPEFRKRFGALPQSVPRLRKRSRASSPTTATGLACYRTLANSRFRRVYLGGAHNGKLWAHYRNEPTGKCDAHHHRRTSRGAYPVGFGPLILADSLRACRS